MPAVSEDEIRAMAYALAWLDAARADWWRSHEVERALESLAHALPHILDLPYGACVEDCAPDNDEELEDDFPSSW